MALYTRLTELYNFHLIPSFCSAVELGSGFVSSNEASRRALSSVNKNKVSLVELEDGLQQYEDW
jgi:hypothetical protein